MNKTISGLSEEKLDKELLQEYYITWNTGDGSISLRRVLGQPIVIKSYLDTFAHITDGGLVRISERKTGLYLDEGINLDAAIENTKHYIEQQGYRTWARKTVPRWLARGYDVKALLRQEFPKEG